MNIAFLENQMGSFKYGRVRLSMTAKKRILW